MNPNPTPPLNAVTRRPFTPRGYARARRLRLIAHGPRRGGWQALALGRRGEIVAVTAERQPGGEFEVWARGETMAYASLFLAVVLRKRDGVLVSRRLLASLLFDIHNRLSRASPQIILPPGRARWLQRN